MGEPRQTTLSGGDQSHGEADATDDLLQQCRQGDENAWQRLFWAHQSYIYRVAFRLGTPADELDDVVQDTFMVVHRKLEQFVGGRFTTWLYRITSNVVSDRHRRRRVRQALLGLLSRHDEPEAPGNPERSAAAAEAVTVVQRALARMGKKRREVFSLYELEGQSCEEIATLLGISAATVRTRLFHARREFARHVQRQEASRGRGGRP